MKITGNGLVKEIPLETLTACPTFSFILAVSKRNPDGPNLPKMKEEKTIPLENEKMGRLCQEINS